MRDADKELAQLAREGITLDAATEAAFRAAWEALPYFGKFVDGPPAIVPEGCVIPVAHSKRKPGRPRKNP